jgi:hypothetical protein
MSGILFIFLFGAFLHFIYELSAQLRPVAIIGAVNESVWEHLKMGFWPAFILAAVEFFVFGKKIKNFFAAKGISITLISLLITGIFYGAVALGIESLALDILIFFISVATAQIISYRMMLAQKRMAALNIIGGILLIINIAAFSLFSYYPPGCPIFKDPVSGGYGIF